MTDKSSAERLTARLLCVTPPDDAQEERMRRFLSHKYGAEVSLSVEIDPSLQSGFRLSVGSEVYDWSAEGRLQQFMESVEQRALSSLQGGSIIPLLKSGIQEFRLLATSSEIGTVLSVGDGIAVVEGLDVYKRQIISRSPSSSPSCAWALRSRARCSRSTPGCRTPTATPRRPPARCSPAW